MRFLNSSGPSNAMARVLDTLANETDIPDGKRAMIDVIEPSMSLISAMFASGTSVPDIVMLEIFCWTPDTRTSSSSVKKDTKK